MRLSLIWLTLALTALLTLTACAKRASWHQKLTLVVETPDGTRSFTNVSEINYRGNLKWAQGLSNTKVRLRGEAIVAELEGQYLFVLLGGVKDLLYTSLLARTDGPMGYKSVIPLIRKQTEPLTVPRKNWPMLVTFEDVNDPTSVRKVDPDDLAAHFGAGYALREVRVQVTDAPVTEGRVEAVLTWWCEYRDRQARLNGSTSVAISTNNLSDVLSTGAFRIGDCQ